MVTPNTSRMVGRVQAKRSPSAISCGMRSKVEPPRHLRVREARDGEGAGELHEGGQRVGALHAQPLEGHAAQQRADRARRGRGDAVEGDGVHDAVRARDLADHAPAGRHLGGPHRAARRGCRSATCQTSRWPVTASVASRVEMSAGTTSASMKISLRFSASEIAPAKAPNRSCGIWRSATTTVTAKAEWVDLPGEQARGQQLQPAHRVGEGADQPQPEEVGRAQQLPDGRVHCAQGTQPSRRQAKLAVGDLRARSPPRIYACRLDAEPPGHHRARAAT